MSTVLLSIKTDAKTKRELKEFARELGITSTTLVNLAVKQVLRDRRLVVSDTLEPTPYLEKIMRKVDKDIKRDRDIVHTSSKEEALAYLDSLMQK